MLELRYFWQRNMNAIILPTQIENEPHQMLQFFVSTQLWLIIHIFSFFFCLTLDPKPINSCDFTSRNHNSAYLVDLCINGIHFIQFADEIDFSQTEKPICLQRNFYVCNSQFKCYSLSVRHQSYSLLSFCFCCKFFFRIFRFFYFLTFNGNNRFPANPFDVYFRIQILPNCKIWAK